MHDYEGGSGDDDVQISLFTFLTDVIGWLLLSVPFLRNPPLTIDLPVLCEQRQSAIVDGEQRLSATNDGEQYISATIDGEQQMSVTIDGEQYMLVLFVIQRTWGYSLAALDLLLGGE